MTILGTPARRWRSTRRSTAAPGQTIGVTVAGFDADGDALTYAVTGGADRRHRRQHCPALSYTAPRAIGTYTFGFTATDPSGHQRHRRRHRGRPAPARPPPPATRAWPTPGGHEPGHHPGRPATPTAGVTFARQPAGPRHRHQRRSLHRTYLPAANYNGPDSFTFTVTDGGGNVATGTITLAGDAGQRPGPRPTPRRPRRPDDGPGRHPRCRPPTSTVTPSPAQPELGPGHGTVTIAGNVATYTPAGACTAAPSAFVFRATDPGGKFGSAAVTVNVGLGGPLPTPAGPGRRRRRHQEGPRPPVDLHQPQRPAHRAGGRQRRWSIN